MSPPSQSPPGTAGEPDYNDFEMIMSPKVLLPARDDGTLVSTGPQFRASGDVVLPEHVPDATTAPTTAPKPAVDGSPSLDRTGWELPADHNRSLPSHPLAGVVHHGHSGSSPPRTEDQLEWEVAAKGGSDDSGSAKQKEKKKKRRCACCCGCCGFCGLSKKMKWLVGTLVSLLLLGAILGGVLGGLATYYRYNDYPSSSPSLHHSLDYRDVEESAVLAAINWTDATDEVRRAVFYPLQGALMMKVWHATNESWASHNISADFQAQNLNTPSIKAGTPLAAAATPAERGSDTDFVAALFYLNSDNEIRALVSHDAAQLGSWSYDEDHASRSAANYTQLAAAADFCDGGSDSSRRCRNAFCYAYQNRDQNVMFACGDAWDEPTQLGGAHPGGALALAPFAAPEDDGGNDNDNATSTTAMRVLHYTDTTVKLFQVWGNSSWDSDEKPILSSVESRENSGYGSSYRYVDAPRVVAAPANSSDAGSLFALALMDNYDAEAKAALYAGGAWTRDQAVELAGHTANVTLATSSLAGAALDHAGTFYVAARSAWAIFEYAWDLDDPFVLTYVRDIMIDDPCLYSWDGCE